MRFVNHHQGCCGYVPTHADGSEWAHVLTLDAGRVVYADSAHECLVELIPRYERAGTDAERLAARTAHAVTTAEQAQASRVAAARTHGLLPADPRDDDADDAAVVALLTAPKDRPLLLSTPDAPGRQAPWEGPAAVVAVRTVYADTEPLAGDVVWLDPTTEEGYLASLAAAGTNDYWSA